jgi:RNA polymerase sigma-70 factor (ECF subfamily)
MPIDPADALLVQRAKTGDIKAFEELFNKYQKPIYNMLLRMLRSSDDASDLTQDTFIKAYRALGSLREEAIFYPWLRQIAVNLARNQWKRAGRVRISSLDETQSTDEGEEMTRELPDWSGNPEDLAQNEELRARVEQAISTLSEDHRAVITLHHLEGMPVTDIAQLLNISVGTVKSRLSRARDQLHRKLSGYVLPPDRADDA